MTDPAETITLLEALMAELDPRKHEVAIAHLQDAIDALDATAHEAPTRYAKSGKIIDGTVLKKGKVRLFK